jgi:uncharacterized repeat protein (TIGR01451 family)
MKLNPVPHALVLALGLAAIGADAYAAATPAGTSIINQATATYIDSTLAARSATSNTVTTIVQQVASVTLSAGTAKNGSVNGTVTYAHTITNNGNGADSFALATTNNGAFTMASVAFYADANGDGIADNNSAITTTGTLQPGQSVQVVTVATLPASAANGAANNLVVTAASVFHGATTATATDVTTVAPASVMDITVNSAGSGAPGAGAGAETAAVQTKATTAGNVTRFTLYLNNAGTSTDTFNLSSSTDANFGTTTLPDGWTVTFKDASGATITSASVAGGANTLVYADVTPPAGATPGTTDLYFRAQSPTTNVVDRVHTAVTVNAAVGAELRVTKTQALDADCNGVADTAFSADNITTGAVPGACIRYEITATNQGGNAVGAVVINDLTPANTTYHLYSLATGAFTTQGIVIAPLPNTSGLVQATVGTLLPNGNAKMSFGVRINP